MDEKKKKVEAEVGRMENRTMVGDILDDDPFNVTLGFSKVVKKVTQNEERIHQHSDTLCGLQEQITALREDVFFVERDPSQESSQEEFNATDCNKYRDLSLLDSDKRQEYALGMAEELWEKLEQFCDEHEIRMVLSNLQKRLVDFHLKAKVHAESGKAQDPSE